MKKGNAVALLPIGVFLMLYLGLGLMLEYGMGIPMGFYNVPITAAFLVAILTACLINRRLSFDEKLELMGQGVGDKNIITMLLIFLVAGAFVGVVGRSSAQSVAYFMLSIIPPQFAVAVLFVVGCFISTAMGTSVGTITLLTPIAVEVAGVNVFVVLIAGVVSGALITLLSGSIVPEAGQTVLSQLLMNVSSNMAGMFETCMVAVLVSALCALIREDGGFDALLHFIRRIFRGNRGGQLGVGLMVAAMDAATANNTVAIVMANPIAKEMSQEYDISPQRTACLLDTFSCIAQGVIPYGAQVLVALSAASKMGCMLSAFDLLPKLYYPMVLLACSLVAVFLPSRRKKA